MPELDAKVPEVCPLESVRLRPLRFWPTLIGFDVRFLRVLSSSPAFVANTASALTGWPPRGTLAGDGDLRVVRSEGISSKSLIHK